jgi:hypothetical protein
MKSGQTTSRLAPLFFVFFTGQNDIILYQNKPFWSKRIVSLK